MRILRGILFGVAVFVGFAAIGLMLLPKERIAKLASAQISKALGREVTLSGEIGLSIWPVLGVKTGPVRVAGPAWDDTPLLVAEGLNIGVAAAAALRREIEIRHIDVLRPEITLITAKDGRMSWDFGSGAGAAEGERGRCDAVQPGARHCDGRNRDAGGPPRRHARDAHGAGP